jgi:allantoate deiminase/N-carbamoyl-L-amino-acid hydrolase
MQFGDEILRQAQLLGAITEEPGRLTRTYLTPQHREAGEHIAAWMREAGMTAHFDALGNVVGRYQAARSDAPVLLTGSHMDTVVDAGRYDGLFGVLSPIACVKSLHERGVRLPYTFEIAAFGDEEGVRFGVSMIGSRALAGRFDYSALDRRDAAGVSLREAIVAFGGDPQAIGSLARAHVVAYIEAHIEQGPVLLDQGLPVGVVTSIAGGSRVRARVEGLAGHAGTVPMHARRDALAAASEMVLGIERHCADRSHSLVGTVGKLAVTGGGAINVIPGAVDFTVDVRSGDDAIRRQAVVDVESQCRAVAARRGVTLSWETFFELAAAPCDPRLQAQWQRSIEAMGVEARHLPSGAGHDAMEFASIAPIAMLFVRCGNGGISHNPQETLSAGDADLATRVFLHFLENFDPRSVAA